MRNIAIGFTVVAGLLTGLTAPKNDIEHTSENVVEKKSSKVETEEDKAESKKNAESKKLSESKQIAESKQISESNKAAKKEEKALLAKINAEVKKLLDEDKTFAESNEAYSFATYLYSIEFRNNDLTDIKVVVPKGYLELSKEEKQKVTTQAKGIATTGATVAGVEQDKLDKMGKNLSISLKFY